MAMAESRFFEYGDTETNWLKTRDEILGNAIDEIGRINRPVVPDIFEALVHAIVGQQISTKAHLTIWARIEKLVETVSPKTLSAISDIELQKCGLTMRKTVYIKDIADSVLSGDIDLNALYCLSDNEVCEQLKRVKGIGTWTAEMLMTFSMQRPDILSWNDLAIHRGLRMLYRQKEITPTLFAKYKRRYSPYATVASLYLWAIAGGACPHMTDPAQKKKNPAS